MSKRFLTAAAAALLAFSGLATMVGAPVAAAANVTLPDMEIKVPTNGFRSAPPAECRQLPSPISPGTPGRALSRSTQTITRRRHRHFSQAIYNSPSPGVSAVDHSVPLAVTGVFDPPFRYRFPLTSSR